MFDNLFAFMGPLGTAGALFAVVVSLVGVFSLASFGRCHELDRRSHAR